MQPNPEYPTPFLVGRKLTDIALLSNFVHLRFLDISSNCLSDLSPLAALTQLLWLKVDGNRVESLAGQPMNQLAYLQCLSMATNRIHSPEGLKGLALESLNLIGQCQTHSVWVDDQF